MIATFPHMGNMSVPVKTLLSSLGLSVKTAPLISKKTLEIGTRYAPETVCLPFKIGLGNFIEALNDGADTIVTCGGVGPCRLGYYGEIQRIILKELNYDFNMITLEPNPVDLLKTLRSIATIRSIASIYRGVRLAKTKLYALDVLEKEINEVRVKARVKDHVEKIWMNAVKCIDAAQNEQNVKTVYIEYCNKIKTVSIAEGIRPLRIGLVGEIYVMLEPYISDVVVKLLNNMGVYIYRTLTLSEYVYVHLLKEKKAVKEYNHVLSLAKPYLGHYVGGHGIMSVGQSIKLAKEQFDGIIHIYPFGCMPEVIVKNILPRVSNDYNIPILSIAFDEQTGEAGLITRLEAFVDLLKHRQAQFNRCLYTSERNM